MREAYETRLEEMEAQLAKCKRQNQQLETRSASMRKIKLFCASLSILSGKFGRGTDFGVANLAPFSLHGKPCLACKNDSTVRCD
jgi:hypothetical protein